MKKYSALVVILYFLFPCASVTYSQDLQSYESTIGKKSLEDYITFLASDETYGRATGGAGNQLAASMIRGEFEKYGLIPFYHQVYTQSFKVNSVIGRNIIAVVQSQ